MQRLYIATEKFGPSHGNGWSEYIAWSGLTQLVETVGLDGMLNPSLLRFSNAYWAYVVNENNMLDFFTDADFLKRELGTNIDGNLIGTIKSPSHDVGRLQWDGFAFCGYELLDQDNATSALTNCGGFPEVFRNEEISTIGLLESFDRALEIQRDLKRLNPMEHHADCNIWAVFRWQVG